MAKSHYFASTTSEWAVGETRKAAFEALIKRLRVRRGEEVRVLSCRVPLPISANYRIVNYLPEVSINAVKRSILNHKGEMRSA